jgi:hypothetical protein
MATFKINPKRTDLVKRVAASAERNMDAAHAAIEVGNAELAMQLAERAVMQYETIGWKATADEIRLQLDLD